MNNKNTVGSNEYQDTLTSGDDASFPNIELVTNNDWQTVELNGETVEIPVGWSVKTFDDVAYFENGDWGSSPSNENVGVICYRKADYRGTKILKGETRRVSKKPPFIFYGDIVIEKSGGGEKNPVGGAAMVLSKEKAICSNFMVGLKAKEGQNNWHLFYSYLDLYNSSKIYALFQQTTGIQNLNIKELKLTELITPPLPEQTIIANLLSTQEDHIASLKQRASLERKKLAFLTDELLSGRILVEADSEGEEVVVTRDENGQPLEVLPAVRLLANNDWQTVELNGETVEIPVGWRVQKVNTIASNTSGATPPTTEERYWGGGLVWITPRDMDDLDGPYLTNSGKTLTQQGYSFMKNRVVRPGSIVFSTRGSIGKVGCAKKEIRISQSCESFFFYNSSPEFYVYFFRQHMGDIQKMGAGTTFMSITRKDIDAMEVLIPSPTEQTLIASLLSTQEDNIRYIQKQIMEEEKVLTWLSDKLLTGKLKIKEVQ